MSRKRFDFGAGQTVIINGNHLHILSGRCIVEQRVKQGERFLKVNGRRRKKLTKPTRQAYNSANGGNHIPPGGPLHPVAPRAASAHLSPTSVHADSISGHSMTTWIEKARAMLRTAEILAKFTRTATDDEIIAAVKTAIENPQIQAVIDWVINTIHVSPELSTQAVIDRVPPQMMAQAEEAYGKRGDGKIIAFIIKILPLILAL